MSDEPRSPTRKGAPPSLEKRYALEEETLRHMAASFRYAARSRDLERSAGAIAALRAENERLRAEREEASQAALDWCVGSLPTRYNDLRDGTRAEILGFALYLYARALVGSVASEKARAEAAGSIRAQLRITP